MKTLSLLAVAAALAALPGVPVFGAEEIDLSDTPAQTQSENQPDKAAEEAAKAAELAKAEEEKRKREALDADRARLRAELKQDKANDVRIRSIQTAESIDLDTHNRLQQAYRDSVARRGRQVLAGRGDGNPNEASEEMRQLSQWAKDQSLTDKEKQRLENRRQGANAMTNAMQAWAKGEKSATEQARDTRKAERERREELRREEEQNR